MLDDSYYLHSSREPLSDTSMTSEARDVDLPVPEISVRKIELYRVVFVDTDLANIVMAYDRYRE